MGSRIASILATISLESAQDETPNDQSALNETATLDEAVSDVIEYHREVEDSFNDAEILKETAQGLESLIATLESLEKPLDPTAAVFMNIAAESHLLRVGLNMNDAPTILSFESTATASEATRLSVASIKTKLLAIWEAIKQAFLRVRQTVIEFFKRLFDSNVKLRERAEGLRAETKKVTTNVPKSKTVDLGIHAYRLHVDGKVDQPMKHFEDVIFLAEQCAQNPAADLAKSSEFTQAILRAKDDQSLRAAIDKLKTIEFKVPSPFSERTIDGDVVIYRTKELPGGTRFGIEIHKPDAAKDGIEHLKHLARAVEFPWKRDIPLSLENTQAETLSLTDIERVAAGVKVLADKSDKLKKEVEEVSKSIEELGKRNAEVKFESLGGYRSRKIIDAYRAMVSFGHFNMKLPTSLAAYSVRVAHGYLAYARKSLAQYQ